MQYNGLGQGVGKDGMMFGETLLIGSLVDVDHGEVSERWTDIFNGFFHLLASFRLFADTAFTLSCTLFIES